MNVLYIVRRYTKGNWGFVIHWPTGSESADGYKTKAGAKEAAVRRILFN